MESIAQDNGNWKKVRIALGLMLFVASWTLASRGIAWSTYFHPDEVPVATWVNRVNRIGYIDERVYPGGWFELIRPYVWWQRFKTKNALRISEWTEQDGRVSAADEKTFERKLEDPSLLRSTIQTGRDFNALLLACSALLVYLAALAVGCHAAAALFAGALLAVNPCFLEHAHYCETDLGLVVSLALFSWLAALSAKRRSLWLAFMSAFVAGFGFACKFTLLPIVVPAVVIPCAGARWMGRRRVAWGALFAIAALALFALGFIAGTPAIYKAPEFFFKGTRSVTNGTYGEAVGLSAAKGWAHTILVRLGSLLRESWKEGWPLLAWSLASLGFWFAAKWRKFALGLPVFFAIFLPFAVFGMPWIRNQEMLPVFVPLCLSSALPLDAAIRALDRRNAAWRRALAAAAAVAAGFVFYSVLDDGLRMTSAFSRREARAECQNWLFASVPEDTVFAIGNYVGQVAQGLPILVHGSGRMEEAYRKRIDAMSAKGSPAAYYLRNSSFAGRGGNMSPFLRRLNEQSVKNIEEFNGEAVLLKTWKISGGRIRPIFAQSDCELWCIPLPGEPLPAKPALDVPLLSARPVHFRWAGSTYYASREIGPIGPREAIQTVGKRRWVCPPPDSGGRFWAVSCSEAGNDAMKVVWQDYFTPSKATFEAGHAAYFTGKSSPWKSALARDALPRTRVRMRGDDQSNLCLTTVVTDPAEAAYDLRSHGEPRAALELLSAAGIEGDRSMTQAFMAAVEAGETPEPDWIEASRRTRDACAALFAAVDADGDVAGGASVCGVPLRALRDFARIRFRAVFAPDAETPVYLPPGHYSMRISEIGREPCSIDLDIRKGERLRMNFADLSLPEEQADFEIIWDPMDFLREEYERLVGELEGLPS